MKLAKRCLILTALACAGISYFGHPAYAQNTSVSNKAREKAIWYTAPPEIQMIDDRPTVRDFREAPQNPGSISLPPGPGAGAAGGQGAGALGSQGGATIPAGGLHIPGNGPGYRAGLNTLPQSGFGGSNIPSRGMGPRGLLPGVTQGVVGKVMAAQNKAASGAAAKGMRATPARTMGNTQAPAAAAYSGGYGTASGTSYGGSSGRTEARVRGSLLKK